MTSPDQNPQPIRILHLEDDPVARRLVPETLRAAGISCEIHRAENRLEFEAALGAGGFHLIIADFTLPAGDGAEALRTARRLQPDVPFIFFSGSIGEEQTVESLKSGATDHVFKQRPERLAPAVQRALREADEHRRRRVAEEVLKQQEERFREMAGNIREVFWCTSPDGQQLLYASPAYAKIWKRPLAELYARPASRIDAVVPDDRPRLLGALEQLSRGTAYDLEYRIAWPDGTDCWIEERGYPVRHPDRGTVERVVGVAIDITDRKLLEEQLRQAQKMEAIGRLAGGIAHDFNNVLTVINGRSRLLLDTAGVPAEIAESIRDIYLAGERAARLTRQLLVFGRQQFMHSQLVDLNEVTEDVAKMLRSMIGEHISLELKLTAGRAAVMADASMLEQVLMNLAVNARDAMPRGGRLTITTAIREITTTDWHRNREAVLGQHVCLEIRDTGGGIPPEILPRIFEPFFTTKELGKGSGLGLSTVFGICKHHHGWVEVDSEVGRGAVFRVFLPLSEEAFPVPVKAPATPRTPRGKETILLVEDEAPVREFASAVLGQFGYRVLQAASGVEALEVWRWHSAKISLLLTDLVMPDEISGIELAKTLQAERPLLKVIFASGYSPDSSRPAFASLKGMNFLHKPYSPAALAQMVREVLDQERPAVVP